MSGINGQEIHQKLLVTYLITWKKIFLEIQFLTLNIFFPISSSVAIAAQSERVQKNKTKTKM